MIEVWGRKNAYNVQKVIWTLHELNLEYLHHDIGSIPGDLDSDEFLAINPHARIPVIFDKGEFVWESNTIIRYLASTYGSSSLWDSDPLGRTHADRWMDWELATLQPDFIELFWNYFRTPEEQHDELTILSAKKRCEGNFQKLDIHLQDKNYLAGQTFTMGDIACATCLYRYFSMGVNIEKPHNVLAWYKRLTERDAYRECIMVPYHELKGRIQF